MTPPCKGMDNALFILIGFANTTNLYKHFRPNAVCVYSMLTMHHHASSRHGSRFWVDMDLKQHVKRIMFLPSKSDTPHRSMPPPTVKSRAELDTAEARLRHPNWRSQAQQWGFRVRHGTDHRWSWDIIGSFFDQLRWWFSQKLVVYWVYWPSWYIWMSKWIMANQRRPPWVSAAMGEPHKVAPKGSQTHSSHESMHSLRVWITTEYNLFVLFLIDFENELFRTTEYHLIYSVLPSKMARWG